MKQIHPIQMEILKKLLFSSGLRYKDMKPNPDMDNSKFDFHLDMLIQSGYITKQKNEYTLTNTGKEFANRMDTVETIMVQQAKIGAVICPIKSGKAEDEYLIYTRLKHPFFGCQGFLSGKILYGESVIEGARRELIEETGLSGEIEIMNITHYRVYDIQSKILVEDKFLFFCRVMDPAGKLNPSPEGKYEWVKEKDLFRYVTNHFESIERFKDDIGMLKNFNGTITFNETTQYTEKF